MQISKMFVTAIMAGGVMAGAAQAQIVSQWNFNSPVPDATTSTGTLTPSTGAGVATLVGGTVGSFSSGDANGGSTDPAAGDDSGWQTTTYPAQGTNSGTAGIQFNVSTLGSTDIGVTWDQRHSNTSSRYLQFQYSTDGISFTSAGLLNDGIFSGTAGDTWFNNRTVDLSAIDAVENNASFAFRIVSVFDPGLSNAYSASNAASAYAGTGTWRFDMVTVHSNIPAPGALALLALAGLTARRRRAH